MLHYLYRMLASPLPLPAPGRTEEGLEVVLVDLVMWMVEVINGAHSSQVQLLLGQSIHGPLLETRTYLI